MSPVRIKPRQLASPCPVCGKTRHLRVVFRMGGRGFPELGGGTFHYDKDARARRDFIAGELAAGRNPLDSLHALTVPPAAPVSLAQIGAGYLDSRVDYSAGSARGARTHVKRLVEILDPDTDPAQITVTRCIDTVAELAKTLSPASVVKYMSTLKMLLDYAGVDPNPARDDRVKMPTITHVEPDPPTSQHVLAVLDRVAHKYRRPLIVMEQTGMTVGEVVGLEWTNVDVPGLRFRLRREDVKGAIAARARWVQVPDWFMAAISLSCPSEDRLPGRRVFPGVSVDAIQKAVQRACRDAEIPGFTPHDLRHRRASLWHGQGIPARELASRIGHTDPHMTLNTYSHVMPLDEIPVGLLEQLVRP